MIKNFKIENCLSVRDEQELDFVATGDNTYEDFTIVKKGNTRLSKLGLIYGANASGKTNIVFALGWLVRFINGRFKDKEHSLMCAPFLLDEDSRTRPSRMSLSFYIDDTLYDYSMSILENVVQTEKMVRYPSGRASLVFDRKWNDETKSYDITFGPSLKLSTKQGYILTGLARPNASVIAAYINNNVDHNEVFEALKNTSGRASFPLFRATPKCRVSATAS